MEIYTFEPFGYDGILVRVETDFRDGIPSHDICGISDGAVMEKCGLVKSAIMNSGFEMPQKRILQTLSPADMFKMGTVESLAMAVGILNPETDIDRVLILGDLELSGKTRLVHGVNAGIMMAKEQGISRVVVPSQNSAEAMAIDGIEVLAVSSLYECVDGLRNGFFKKTENPAIKNEVKFDDSINIDGINLKGFHDVARAIEIAVAGKHNIILTGEPGCGKTMILQGLLPALTPLMTAEESSVTTRIHSIAGLMCRDEGMKMKAPFRVPHQTASVEGICGGGIHCMPGEISLAHNGTLFLDEASEFKSYVLQMLRVPLSSRTITLSRAGRKTVYPASFQLAIATNPCPCGNYGSENKVCLCSAKAIENHWNKFSAPLLSRIEIKKAVKRNDDGIEVSIEGMKEHIARAIGIQRRKGAYNSSLTEENLEDVCISPEAENFLEGFLEHEIRPFMKLNILKVALTVANMDGRETVEIEDIKESCGLATE